MGFEVAVMVHPQSRLLSKAVQPTHLHSWDVEEAEAKKVQLRRAPLVVPEDDFSNVDLVGGVSIRPIAATIVQAAACVTTMRPGFALRCAAGYSVSWRC